MGERMKGLLGMLGMRGAVNPEARLQTGEALPTGQDQFNTAKERADIPSPRADYADKSRIAKNTGFGLTQQMMRDFDPSDNEQVLQMQQAMNAAGIKGADGKALAEDGMLGPNTMRALRFAQGQGDEMQDALPLREFGEPQGGVGPSYEGMYNEDSRDIEKREANPPSNPVMNWLQRKGMVKKIDKQGVRGSGTNRFGTGQGGRFY